MLQPGAFQVFCTFPAPWALRRWDSSAGCQVEHTWNTPVTGQEPFLRTSPSCRSISVVPWWARTQSRPLAFKQTVQCASGLALPWSSHAAGVTTVLQPDHEPSRTGGGDGEAKLCQEWAQGMQQRSHCRAGTNTCRSFQPAACWNSWTEGSPKAWETSSGRWPAPTVSSSCLAYAKYNKMY